MKRIYVGNLSPLTTAAELQNNFERFGKVQKLGMISELATGKPLGFAFVLMKDDGEGEAAIHQLNQHRLNGRPLDVREALPPNQRSAAELKIKARA